MRRYLKGKRIRYPPTRIISIIDTKSLPALDKARDAEAQKSRRTSRTIYGRKPEAGVNMTWFGSSFSETCINVDGEANRGEAVKINKTETIFRYFFFSPRKDMEGKIRLC